MSRHVLRELRVSLPQVPDGEQKSDENRLTILGCTPLADELAFPGVWESDEELDDFLADLYASRRASMP
jgi:hypothetical protein